MSEPAVTTPTQTAPAPTDKLTKKALTADHPTWCPGCGDFAVLSSYYKVLEKRNLPHQNIVTLAGIGCSSRFPYFMNTYGAHFIHGRAIPFASGVSLSRPDLNVFVFGGDGDGYSIGGNHLEHGARKNINLVYFIMDNFVYGLTKKQTSPTSPLGYKSKTDPSGAVDRPINPIKKLISAGATFVARTHATYPAHMIEMIEKAMDHEGFAVIECLSECVEFYPGAFDAAITRKGGNYKLIDASHNPQDEYAAYKLADEAWPGVFGVFYQAKDVPSKNKLEKQLVDNARTKLNNPSDLDLLQKSFDRLK